MRFRVKDWEKFQHFKDRRPPWVKLYRDLLDDPDWHELDAEAAKVLVMLWLVASEDREMAGNLPDCRKLAFRLRMSEKVVIGHCSKLSHWLEQVDTEVISDGYHDDAPETETETETETDIRASRLAGFDEFWKSYPKRKSRGQAEKAWAKIKPNEQLTARIITAVQRATTSAEWQKDGGQFIPYPASWLNAKGWEDEITPSTPPTVNGERRPAL